MAAVAAGGLVGKGRDISLAALQRHDPYINRIVDVASQVALYTFGHRANEWVRVDATGSGGWRGWGWVITPRRDTPAPPHVLSGWTQRPGGGRWAVVSPGSRQKLGRGGGLRPWGLGLGGAGGRSLRPSEPGARLKYLQYPMVGARTDSGRDPENWRKGRTWCLEAGRLKYWSTGRMQSGICYRKTVAVAVEGAGVGCEGRVG